MADERLRVDTGELFLTDRERDDRDLFSRDLLVAELLVERNVGVAVDRRYHGSLLAGRAELLDVRHDRLPIGVTERRVVDHDVGICDSLRLQVSLEDLVRRAGIYVVRACEHPALHLDLVHQVVDGRNRLLVRRRARVEHVLRRLLTFVLHGVEQQAVQFLEDGQHRLPAHRRPAAEHGGDLLHLDQLARLFGEQRPIGRRVDDHRFQFLAEQAAFGVLLGDQHQHRVLQRRLADGHRAG